MLERATIYFYCLFDESIFQTCVFLTRVIECIIELYWLCRYIKRVRSRQPAILVLYWIEQRTVFFLWVSLKGLFEKINISEYWWYLLLLLLYLNLAWNLYAVQLYTADMFSSTDFEYTISVKTKWRNNIKKNTERFNKYFRLHTNLITSNVDKFCSLYIAFTKTV